MNMHVGGADAQRVNFKVGDRVRAVETSGGRAFVKGGLYTVTGLSGRNLRAVNERGDDDSWSAEFFEPAPTFQVGDRVRAIADNPRGEVGRIHNIDYFEGGGASYLVEFDTWRGGHEGVYDFPDDRGWYLDAWELELLPLTIAAGRHYKTRSGDVVGPMEVDDIGFRAYVDGYGRIFDGAGGHVFGDADLDLVEEVSAPVLKIEAGKYYRTRDGRKVGPMRASSGDWGAPGVDDFGKLWLDNGSRFTTGNEHDHLIAEWTDEPVAAAPATSGNTPAIVARIDNGQPRPAALPFVHPDRASAEREAARLAGANPGKEFAVYEFVSVAREERQYEHEWQRAAKNGREYDAACLLQDIAGTSFLGAQAAVTHWLTVAA